MNKSKIRLTEKGEFILDSAARLFAIQGYHHTKVSEIARQVNLEKGSLYYYIRSKEDLLYEIIMLTLDLYKKSLKKLLESKERPNIVIQKAIIAHVTPMDIRFDYAYVFIHELRSLPPKYKKQAEDAIAEYENLWINIIEKGKRLGILRRDLDSKLIMLSIFGMCNWMLRWYKRGGKYDAKDIGEHFGRIVLNGIISNKCEKIIHKERFLPLQVK